MVDVDDVERRSVDAPTDLKFVGPATADAVEAAAFSAQAIADKEVSYRMLLEAGVNAGVAAKIRRHHSLAWSFDNDGDLDRRSEQVRGLQEDEAAWVASSHDEETGPADDSADARPDPTPGEESDADEAAWVEASTRAAESSTDDSAESDDAVDEETAWVADATSDDASATADGSGDPLAAEAAWRERSKPTPLTDLSGVGESYADRLAEAGVTSVRSLATASPELLSDVTGIAEERLRRWHREASEKAD
ncbi:Helix-hairpin-helix domain-containing protein [Halolamina pelagica]|uniref:Helix-hairpin-helix domain-containing protein n=2 Tax=Haloferacaceae TaxID=1644056 RepID=A0A1I5QXQ7_9EURY|nr:Helix-hairpin-helix domain-containing protein [Halolamina pelagica]